MFTYIFTVDRDLNIVSWDENLEGIRSQTFYMVAGVPYFNLLPRLWQHGTDAVGQVIGSGRSIHIRDYPIPCFYEAGTTDLSIRPLKSGETVSGAEIELSSYAGCSISHKLRRSQSLIHMGKFSTTLAHGVRNPLNAIKGAVVYLNQKYSEESTLREFVSIIEEEIDKLDRFITRFLSNSLVELETSPVDVNKILEKVVALCRLQTYAQNVSFSCNYAELPTIEADSFLIEHAILNIVNNAIESLHNAGVIMINTRIAAADSNLLIIEIEDTGYGIPPETMEALRRGDERGNRKGRGFGLFITREIIQLHGGYVEITSEKDRGAKVRINLPIER